MSSIVTIRDIASVIAIIEPGPAPIQTMNIGPRAVLGRALRTTRYGSRTLERKGLHHNNMAMTVPAAVPRRKPAAVSAIDVPAWSSRSPPASMEVNVLSMRPGLLKIKGSIAPHPAAISQAAKKMTRSMMRARWVSRSLRRICSRYRRREGDIPSGIYIKLLPYLVEIFPEGVVVPALHR